MAKYTSPMDAMEKMGVVNCQVDMEKAFGVFFLTRCVIFYRTPDLLRGSGYLVTGYM